MSKTIKYTVSDFDKGFDFIPKEGKIFISLPMSGFDEDHIRKRMNNIFNLLIDASNRDDFALIDNYTKTFPNIIGEDRISAWIIGTDIKLLATADLAIFSDDYWRSRGCLTEYYICNEYSIPYCFESHLSLFTKPHNTGGI